MKARFIFNPRSGHNARNPYLLDRAKAFIAEQRLDATVVLTERPRHATDLARAAVTDGCDLVVAIGGDGTMNEVAAALTGTTTALGLIPCGSGNGLGRHLGIPNPGQGAFRALLHGRPRAMDVGFANGIPFFNAMGLGFDAEISEQFNHLTRRGLPAYVRTTGRLWFKYQPQLYTIRNGTSQLTTPAFIVAVANSDQYGNDCFIAPGATVDDGELDLTVIKRVSLLSALPLAAPSSKKSTAAVRSRVCGAATSPSSARQPASFTPMARLTKRTRRSRLSSVPRACASWFPRRRDVRVTKQTGLVGPAQIC